MLWICYLVTVMFHKIAPFNNMNNKNKTHLTDSNVSPNPNLAATIETTYYSQINGPWYHLPLNPQPHY